MKLWDIVKNVGSSIVREAVPGGGLLLSAVNELLPDDKKLPSGATGSDIESAINSLPSDKKAELLNREFDVDITQIKESNSTVRAMLDADTKNPHTTRPYIAKGAFHIIAFVIVVTVSLWAYGVGADNDTMVSTIMDGWQFILAVIGPLVTLLWAYFGVLKQEQSNRLNAANGSTTGGLSSIIANIVKR